VLIQVYLLLDCCDGELARLTGRTSATGVYLDGIGHYLGEMAVLRDWLDGFAAGWRMDPGDRRPMSARTVWRMARAGRPPII
jgi:hypothetical protein